MLRLKICFFLVSFTAPIRKKRQAEWDPRAGLHASDKSKIYFVPAWNLNIIQQMFNL